MLSKTALEKLNIFSAEDLLHHYPFRYEDLRDYHLGTIVSSKNIFTRSGKTVQKILVKTDAGTKEITYFNQPYLVKTLKAGVNISLAGNEYEVNGPFIHTGRLVPVYPETKGISSKALRRRIYNLLRTVKLEDWLPDKIKNKYNLLDLNSALQQIHFPKNQAQIDAATKRLSFNELFLLQLEAIEHQKTWKEKKLSHQLNLDQEKILNLIASLPFALTFAQNRCSKEILSDLGKNQPMNRLLQGEVGSGKTVIAAIAMYVSYLNGFKSVLMAPTEILAQQHFRTLKSVFTNTPIKIGLVTKSA
ncbi:MAG: DEAD/DEAH box helicase, partial [Patescibacteria group bacterium]